MDVSRILAVGDSDPDSCMLQGAGIGVAFQPKSAGVESAADHVYHDNLLQILDCLGERVVQWKVTSENLDEISLFASPM